MIRFAYNPVSWDDGPIPGSMADRMVAPILEHLPAGRYDIDRYPAHGRLNAYLGMPGTYKGAHGH